MSQHPLSIQLWTVREALAADPDGTLARVAALGFTTVEPFGFVESAKQYAGALSSAGLTPSSGHEHIVGKNLDTVFSAARDLGIPTVIEPMVEEQHWRTLVDIERTATALNEAAEVAAGYGLTVGYHNHWWELESSIDGAPALEVLASLLDPEVVLELDTYWSTVGGVPAADLLKRLGRRVQFMHIKDGPITRDDSQQVAVGSGRMPVLDIIAAAPQAVAVVELDEFSGDVFQALADSVAYLTANGERL